MIRKRTHLPYIICIILCLVVEFLSSSVTKQSVIEWYPTIIKPSFTPPNWVFAPVWTILYLMMGISWGHVNRVSKSVSLLTKQNIAFSIQLLLNATWSYVYFGAHEIGYAWLNLNLIIISLIFTIYYFFKISKFAGWLLMPYLLWSIYASVLNGTIWYLN